MIPSNKKTIISIVVSLFVAAVTLVTLVVPSTRRILEVNREMLGRKILLERLYEQGQSTKKVRMHLERVEPLLSVFERSFLYRGEELAFITTMEAAALSHGLDHVLSFSQPQKNQAKTVQETTEIPISLTISGTYQDVFAFLSDLDRFSFYVSISRLSITNSTSREGSLKFGSRAAAPVSPGIRSESGAQIVATLDAVTYWREKK